MFRASCLASVIIFVFTANVAAQDVAYEKYSLPNGMTVILHEDRTMPAAELPEPGDPARTRQTC